MVFQRCCFMVFTLLLYINNVHFVCSFVCLCFCVYSYVRRYPRPSPDFSRCKVTSPFRSGCTFVCVAVRNAKKNNEKIRGQFMTIRVEDKTRMLTN